MAVTVSYPGVYIEEIPSGVRTITGVATSTAAFAGWAPQGPVGSATLLLSWADFARHAADRALLEARLVKACAHHDLHWAARRPAYSALKSERSRVMPSFDRALDQYFHERESAPS